METHIGVSEKRNLDGIFLGVAVLAIATAAVLGWRSYSISAPIPEWVRVVAEVQRSEQRKAPAHEIVLVGGAWRRASRIEGLEPTTAVDFDHAPTSHLVGTPASWLVVRRSEWEALGSATDMWPHPEPLECTGGKWLFVSSIPGVP